MIQFSGHYGDPRAKSIVFPLQRELNMLFNEVQIRPYLKAISLLSFVLRISGTARDFGGCGLERLRYVESESEITIDIILPENCWKTVDEYFLRQELYKYVSRGIEKMIVKAKEIGEIADEEVLRKLIENRMIRFLGAGKGYDPAG